MSCCFEEKGFFASIFEIRWALFRYLKDFEIAHISSKSTTSCSPELPWSSQSIYQRQQDRVCWRPARLFELTISFLASQTFPKPLNSIIPAFLGWSANTGMKMPVHKHDDRMIFDLSYPALLATPFPALIPFLRAWWMRRCWDGLN